MYCAVQRWTFYCFCLLFIFYGSNDKAKDEKRPWILRAREASVVIREKTESEENQSLPQTLIYISCGWESFKEVDRRVTL